MSSKETDSYSVEAIGWRLREARSRAGLTQKDVAGAVGVSANQIGKYERGQDRISAPMLQRLFHVVGEEFVRLAPATQAVREVAGTHGFTRRAIALLQQLSDEEQERVLSSLEEKVRART